MAYDTDFRAQEGLGDFWNTVDDISTFLAKIGTTAKVAAPQIKGVIEGERSIVTVPKGQTTIVSGTGTALGVAIPAWVLPAGIAGLLYFALRRR